MDPLNRKKKMTTPEQAKINRALWIKELRETEKNQCTNALHRLSDDSFCCLGIACEVAISNGVRLERGEYEGMEKYGENYGLLPPQVQDWLGLATDSGVFQKRIDGKGSLSQLNDYSRYTFKQIADIVEREPAGLLKEGYYSVDIRAAESTSGTVDQGTEGNGEEAGSQQTT